MIAGFGLCPVGDRGSILPRACAVRSTITVTICRAISESGCLRRRRQRDHPPELLSPPSHSRSASQKANCLGTIVPLSWIYILSDFDGTERWVSCWFSFGAGPSCECGSEDSPG